MKDFPWGYVVGAAVTVIGLLVNQWRADKREVDRWRKEVDRDKVKWERERAERLEQWKREDQARVEQWRRDDRRRWIDEQRTRYATSLKTARAFLSQLNSIHALSGLEIDEADVKKSGDRLDALMDAFDAADTEVRIIAGEPVLPHLATLRRNLRIAYVNLIPPFTYSEDQLAAAIERVRDSYNAYFRSVREDLGLAEASAESPESPSVMAPATEPESA